VSAVGEILVRLRPRGDNTAMVVRAPTHRLIVYVSSTVVALICSYLLGPDVLWDTLHYHLYAGFSALHDRSAVDYFAAGYQSYFNPYIYVPFYALVASGMPALLASSVLALIHSSVLWLTYELTLLACPQASGNLRIGAGVCAVLLACANPLLIQQFGSSMGDITTCAMVLAGWLLLAEAVQNCRAWLVLGAGLLLGAAAAFKLTNAVHAVSAFALLAFLPRPWGGRLRAVVVCASGMGIGFATVALPWALRLGRAIGNPFFPLSDLRTPVSSATSLVSLRFVPESFADALWRPFAIAWPDPLVQFEALAPDIRYATLILIATAIGARWLYLRVKSPPEPAVHAGEPDSRVVLALGCGLALDWTLWLVASANGRYFLPMACVTAALIAALLFRASIVPGKVRNYALAVILGFQALQLWTGTDYRSAPLPWDGPWFQVSLPQKLASQPNLYLTIGMQSNSFLVPYFAPGSGFTNFSGGVALGSDAASRQRIALLIARYSPHLRMLVRGARLHEARDSYEPKRSSVDDLLARLGLEVDASDCGRVAVRGVPKDLQVTIEGVPPDPEPDDTLYLVSCRVRPRPTERLAAGSEAAEREKRAVDLVLDRVQDACPQLLGRARVATEHVGREWKRFYGRSDVMVWTFRGNVYLAEVIHGGDPANLGQTTDWTNGSPHLACGRLGGRAFARLEP
jgi:hypothetical protein